MKYKLKIFLLIFILMMSCGCGKDIKCKNSYEDNVKYKITIEADVIEDNVSNAKAIMDFESEYEASQICELNNLINNDKVNISCNGKRVIITGYEILEYDNNKNNITKDKFIEKLKNQGFKC